MGVPHEHIMQFFSVIPQPNHALASLWKPFEDLARVIEKLPKNPERTVALRKLLESRDAAVRAAMAKQNDRGLLEEGQPDGAKEA
jgi:hypothetical protein